MVKEVIRFRLPLGPGTDEFLRLFKEVREAMIKRGVEPGVRWSLLTGERTVVVEREFDSLAQYEADEAAFHGGKEFMDLWRRMEALALSMEVDILTNTATLAEIRAQRAGGVAPQG